MAAFYFMILYRYTTAWLAFFYFNNFLLSFKNHHFFIYFQIKIMETIMSGYSGYNYLDFMNFDFEELLFKYHQRLVNFLKNYNLLFPWVAALCFEPMQISLINYFSFHKIKYYLKHLRIDYLALFCLSQKDCKKSFMLKVKNEILILFERKISSGFNRCFSFCIL
jgi:hypothetical protein